MAKLPTFGDYPRSPRISEQASVAAPSMAGAGMVGEALQQVGGQINRFGAELLAKRVDSDNRLDASKAFTEYRTKSEAIKQKNLMEAPEDYKGYAEKTKTELTSLHEELNNSLSNGAQSYFQERTATEHANDLLAADSDEATRRAKFHTKRLEDSLMDSANYFSINPDIPKAIESRRAYLLDIQRGKEGGNLMPSDFFLLKESTNKEFTRSIVNGFINSSNENPEMLNVAQRFINGEEPGSKELIEGMTPNEKAKYQKLIDGKSKYNIDLLLSDTKDKIKGFGAIASDGQANYKHIEEAKSVEANLNNIIATSQDKKTIDEATEQKAQLHSFNVMNNSISNAKYMSANEISNFDVDKVVPSGSLEEEQFNQRVRENVKTALSQRLSKMASDGNQYVKDELRINDPIKNYEMQVKLGIPARAVSKTDSRMYGNMFLAASDSTAKQQVLEKMNRELGPLANSAIQDMVNDKTLPDTYFHINNVDNPETQKSLLAVRDLQKKGAFSETARLGKPDTLSDFRTETYSQFKPYESAFDNMDGGIDLVKSQNIREDISLLAVQYSDERGLNKVEAVKQATEDVIGKNYVHVQATTGNVIIPKKAIEDSNAQANTKIVMDNPRMLFDGQDINQFKNAKFEDEKQFNLALTKSVFVSDGANGMYLTIPMPSGEFKALKYKDGSPVYVPFNKISWIASGIKQKMKTKVLPISELNIQEQKRVR